MIEVASCPANLATWKADDQPFYLEVCGETSPLVDRLYALVGPPTADSGSADGSSDPAAPPAVGPSGPIYQYWWTIGHSASSEQYQRIWSKLQDEAAARVYLFFPRHGGWRIKELVATVNYLHPFREHTTWWNHFADEWKNIVSPTIADASSITGMVPAPAFAGASALLGTIAKLQVNSVPQVGDFSWSVGKVTMQHGTYGAMQGVMWTLPKHMFTDLGSRLTGSIALSIIPAPIQHRGTVLQSDPDLDPLPVLAHAVVYRPHNIDKDLWVPGQRDFVELQLAPRFSAAARTTVSNRSRQPGQTRTGKANT
jgi:hypothetical protein